MKTIAEIASKHLGKAGDGSVVKPYVTPDSIDSSLIVAIPRCLNREQYDIKEDSLDFIGYDVWNCYEVSFLLSNGLPVSGVIKLKYPVQSPSIVESKSLKLYLNSFNMDRFSTLDKSEAISLLESRISRDLTDALGAYVEVKFNNSLHNIFVSDFDLIEDFIYYKDIKFEAYTEAYDILEKSDSKILKAKSSLLRSNCRVTNQPDWGDVFIYMKGEAVPSYESLLQYIVSMRKENHFHEEICECIYQRLFNIFSPEELLVGCLYTRRGGIDINPLRASSVELLDRYFSDYLDLNNIYKTLRQ